MQEDKRRRGSWSLNEHWKRKRRFKFFTGDQVEEEVTDQGQVVKMMGHTLDNGERVIDIFRPPSDHEVFLRWPNNVIRMTNSRLYDKTRHQQEENCFWKSEGVFAKQLNPDRFSSLSRNSQEVSLRDLKGRDTLNPVFIDEKHNEGHLNNDESMDVDDDKIPTRYFHYYARNSYKTKQHEPLKMLLLITFTLAIVVSMITPGKTQMMSLIQSDPRPTIYSGQVSFALLLSAHSSPSSELSTSASQQVNMFTSSSSSSSSSSPSSSPTATTSPSEDNVPTTTTERGKSQTSPASTTPFSSPGYSTTNLSTATTQTSANDRQKQQQQETRVLFANNPDTFSNNQSTIDIMMTSDAQQIAAHHHGKRQIFERNHRQEGSRYHHHRRQQQAALARQQQQQLQQQALLQQEANSICSIVNTDALYAGMGAIWASHQANLVGDSQLGVGTYVYDSCNDLDVGQRQSVRIVSNLNAFQQTTCEAPRGSPISLTIAHGDNQLKAIQLLTSFRVPVITTREHFAMDDYSQLTGDQRKFLFSTAHSSRHLALGALKFSKTIVSRSMKALNPNRGDPDANHSKRSTKNGLIVISSNLPMRFRNYLTQSIPRDYVMHESSHPIEEIKSIEALESIFIKPESSSSSSSSSSSIAESRVSNTRVPFSNNSTEYNYEETTTTTTTSPTSPYQESSKSRARRKRNFESDESGDSDSSGSSSESPEAKMNSPTILMFITRAEAIDLVTRLRNDLSDVSKYFSLIVTTREDISPALRTIFHAGDSKLCPTRGFYTISPKPDEIAEFNRYFRDTVQMEGDTSDHPLICEFAKYQSSTRKNIDLDDTSTETVIKAVWTSAAAFKSVYKQQCHSQQSSSALLSNIYKNDHSDGTSRRGRQSPNSSLSSSSSSSPSSSSSQTTTSSPSSSSSSSSSSSGLSSNSQGGKSECMIKMNKNMSNLVQRALKALDVTINSTGLQSLDGFRIKFDNQNELATNKFTIKYINKECEIIELGHYTGLAESKLKIDEETLLTSIQSTLPEPWPVTVTPPSTPAPAVNPSATGEGSKLTSSSTGSSAVTLATSPGSSTSGSSTSSNGNSDSSNGDNSAGDGNQAENIAKTRGRRKNKTGLRNDDNNSSEEPLSSSGNNSDDDNDNASSESDKAGQASNEAPRLTHRKQHFNRKNEAKQNRKQTGNARPRRRPTTMSPSLTNTNINGRTTMPGMKDTISEADLMGDIDTPITTTTTTTTGVVGGNVTILKQMRKLKPFPNSFGTTLSDWLPTTATVLPINPNGRLPSINVNRFPPNYISGFLSNHHASPGGAEQLDDLKSRATTQAPVFSTLPESGGNADLEPTLRVPKSINSTMNATTPTTKINKQNLEVSATTESSDYVTSPSISKGSYNSYSTPMTNSIEKPPTTLDSLGFAPIIMGKLQDRLNLTSDHHHDDHHHHHDHNHHRQFGTSNPYETAAKGYHSSNPSSDPISLTSSSLPKPYPSFGHRESDFNAQAQHQGRSKLRSHLKWIYSSWFTLCILCLNICGALLTLYVLTLLLIKNCDGSMTERDNQGLRSLHLLAIIVVFFGSTLFIVYPTPSLCLLRTSWYNFALVMLFGTLLLQAMQIRSLKSIGLGGRPNRLNQFLTFIFIVGVQVSFELQRWKYESANYINFVNHHLNSVDSSLSASEDKKLAILSSALANQLNPFNSFNDQVTPISVQLSEQYQTLLHDYCIQKSDDFLQSQAYLCGIVILLIIFSISIRNFKQQLHTNHHTHKPTITSSKQTHRKLINSPSSSSDSSIGDKLDTSQFQFSSQSNNNSSAIGKSGGSYESSSANMFTVTLIIAPIYSLSLLLHIYGQNTINRDLISSVTMVLIAFTTLIGIFIPIVRRMHGYKSMSDSSRITGSLHQSGAGMSSLHAGPILASSSNRLSNSKNLLLQGINNGESQTSTFAMFPEFAPTGLRRPSSGMSDSNSGSRQAFAETKESRRNMGVALANLGPSEDSLRSMGFYNSSDRHHQQHQRYSDSNNINKKQPIARSLINNNTTSSSSNHNNHLSANHSDHIELYHRHSSTMMHNSHNHSGSHHQHQSNHHHHHQDHHHHHNQLQPSSSLSTTMRNGRTGKGEKRLIMLDVDPCCPKHGIAAMSSSSK